MNEKRVPTGVKGLDQLLCGGLLEGSTALVRGAPGTGKTLLGLQYLIHGATHWREPGVLVSFEQFPQALHRDAQALGWDLRALEEAGQLHLLFTSPQVLLADLQSPASPVSRLLGAQGIRRVVIDSVSQFGQLSDDAQELRKVYNTLINALKREATTALLLSEETRGGTEREEGGRLSFMVDVIILLRFIEIDSAMRRGVVVLKMRGSDHAKEIRRFEIGRDGLSAEGVFEGREAILSGTPYRVGSGLARR